MEFTNWSSLARKNLQTHAREYTHPLYLACTFRKTKHNSSMTWDYIKWYTQYTHYFVIYTSIVVVVKPWRGGGGGGSLTNTPDSRFMIIKRLALSDFSWSLGSIQNKHQGVQYLKKVSCPSWVNCWCKMVWTAQTTVFI